MESYHVISGIKVKEINIISEANGSSIFEKQGTVDGACGPYSLFMALKILGELSQDDVYDPLNIDKRRSTFKFMSSINKLKGLVYDGTYLKKLDKLINNNYKTKLETESSQEKDNKLLDFVFEQLNDNKPTIIGVTFPTGGGHWMLAVGYSTNDKGKKLKLLLLDPSGEKPTISPWNSIIEIGSIRKGDFPYHCHTNGRNISFDEALSVWTK